MKRCDGLDLFTPPPVSPQGFQPAKPRALRRGGQSPPAENERSLSPKGVGTGRSETDGKGRMKEPEGIGPCHSCGGASGGVPPPASILTAEGSETVGNGTWGVVPHSTTPFTRFTSEASKVSRPAQRPGPWPDMSFFATLRNPERYWR